MGKVRRSHASDRSVAVIDPSHQRSTNPARQPISRKKANPVSIHASNIVDAEAVVGPSIQSTYAQYPSEFGVPHEPLAPFDLARYTRPQIEVKYPETVQNDARPSTPSRRKRVHAGDDEKTTPNGKRKRELENERNAREKKTAAELNLSQTRAALPREYRAFVETQIDERFGPRTKEVGGENPALDSKMFFADVMARSAVSLGHLGLILKHCPDVLDKAIAMEEEEKEKSGFQGERSAFTVPRAENVNLMYPQTVFLPGGHSTGDMAQDLDPLTSEVDPKLPLMPSPQFDNHWDFQNLVQTLPLNSDGLIQFPDEKIWQSQPIDEFSTQFTF